jgi:LysR family transcriptional regulator, nitrogen assimilation regulatory protein
MEARLLEYFLRVVELGSINRAAAELNMSQPSLSRWLALLEHEIGTPLLIRGRQGVRATDAGLLLIDRSRPILRQFQLLCEEVGRKASAQVTLGMPFSMQRMVTAPFAEQVARQHPHVTLRVYEGINNSLRRWMQEGVLDVAVMACLEHAPESFTTMPILTEKLVLVGDSKAALRLDTQVPLSRLGIAHIILPGRPNVIRALVENTVRRNGYEYHNRFEAETLSLCLELARRGLGYTVMPYCTLHGQLEEGSTLSAAPIDNLSVTWALHVNRAREHAVVVRSLASALLNFISDQLKSGEWRFGEMVATPQPRRQFKAAETH